MKSVNHPKNMTTEMGVAVVTSVVEGNQLQNVNVQIKNEFSGCKNTRLVETFRFHSLNSETVTQYLCDAKL
jgi:hypothetical protein